MTTLEDLPEGRGTSGTERALRVAVIDRARTSRDALCRALAVDEGLSVVDCGPSAISALDHTEPFDALLFHVSTPVADLLDEVAAVAAAHPEARVVVVAAYVDSDVVDQLHRHGATKVLADHVGLDHVRAAIGPASEHGSHPSTASAPATVTAAELGITERESEVLRALSEGRSPQQIAHDAHISVSTVRDHLKHLRNKLDCASAVELVVTAHRLGLLPNLNRPLP